MSRASGKLAQWTGVEHVKRVVDLSAPRSGGAIVVATNGHLARLTRAGQLVPYASGYHASAGLEPYVALSSGGCFGRDRLYALRLGADRGVNEVTAGGRVSGFARVSGSGLLNGIAFDETGRFGHRLLVTSTASGVTTVFALDCHGHVSALTRKGPKIEGGIAVAPSTFGAYAGDLIAPDEVSGYLYAIAPSGQSTPIAHSPTPHGQDVGIESAGFVPARFTLALVADRLTPGNRHPGNDLILGLTRRALARTGVRRGDLLIVNEGGADTIAVGCVAASCRVRDVASGPPEAHIEGHVEFR
jgi:hypothetical protein